VVVDDSFPFNARQNIPAFSQSKGNELWVLILEKAWAKINGSYENTINGYVSEAFKCLTGAPLEYYNHAFYGDFWHELVVADKLNYIICASAGQPSIEDDEYKEKGLISDHSYAVISVHEVETPKEGKVKLLKLMNPWGH